MSVASCSSRHVSKIIFSRHYTDTVVTTSYARSILPGGHLKQTSLQHNKNHMKINLPPHLFIFFSPQFFNVDLEFDTEHSREVAPPNRNGTSCQINVIYINPHRFQKHSQNKVNITVYCKVSHFLLLTLLMEPQPYLLSLAQTLSQASTVGVFIPKTQALLWFQESVRVEQEVEHSATRQTTSVHLRLNLKHSFLIKPCWIR